MTQSGGEKELIIGNKQLISLFFVVVALCGVFFAMGYMVRGNSLKGAVSTTVTDPAAAAPSEDVKRQQPEPPAESTEITPAASRQASDGSVPTIETRPALDSGGSGASTGREPQADSRPAKTESSARSSGTLSSVESGATYVQVGALARGDAEATVRTLREQHLPAILAASSKEMLFRVLVGPYHLTSDVAEAKEKLKTLGFSNTIVQKQ
jgi:cell division septation protein DedD